MSGGEKRGMSRGELLGGGDLGGGVVLGGGGRGRHYFFYAFILGLSLTTRY